MKINPIGVADKHTVLKESYAVRMFMIDFLDFIAEMGKSVGLDSKHLVALKNKIIYQGAFGSYHDYIHSDYITKCFLGVMNFISMVVKKLYSRDKVLGCCGDSGDKLNSMIEIFERMLEDAGMYDRYPDEYKFWCICVHDMDILW